MDAVQILFIILAAATLGSALMVVTVHNMIHAALWLIVSLFGVAALFVLLNAGFIAIVQVVVYIGAIAILIIFAVMMTRKLMTDQGPQANPNWWLAALVSLLLFGALALMLGRWLGDPAIQFPADLPAGANPILELGKALVAPSQYVLPFELASVLLLAALIGSIVVARGKMQE